MKKTKKYNAAFFLLAASTIVNLIFAPASRVMAATNSQPAKTGAIIAKLNFDPKVNGFGFENFGNEHRYWQDDLTADDMIRLFGAQAVCKTGNTPQNCVMKAAAREWVNKQLEGMDDGHCEGMAATSLRFLQSKGFKGKVRPADFQAGANMPFSLKLNQPVENYIAYYFVTQLFEEIYEPTGGLGKSPLAVVKTLIDSMKSGSETYTLGIYAMSNGELGAGHAITPIAVEDAGNTYKIHVYDNNYPGETRYITVQKGGKQTWEYITSTNPDEPSINYVGDIKTESLQLTASSGRDRNGKFRAPFDESANSGDEEEEEAEEEETKKPAEKPAPKKPEVKPAPVKPQPTKPAPVKPAKNQQEMLEFALLGEGDVLIVSPEGKRVGFDFKQNRMVNEIAGAEIVPRRGGLGKDLSPIYRLPASQSKKPYTVTVSGKTLKRETDADFSFSGNGFTIGLDEILLDPGETLTFTVTAQGGEISYTASNDGEMPEIYFATDKKNGYSYLVELFEDILKAASSKNDDKNGVQFLNAKFNPKNAKALPQNAGTTLTAKFDARTGKLTFRDSDNEDDVYDIDVRRISPNGVEQSYETDNVEADESDATEADFGSWNGKDSVCFREDDEGNGFADEKCEPQPNEDNDADVKGDRDGDGDSDDDGITDNVDSDDDNDGIADKADKDDDGDGIPDVEDDDEADLDGDGLTNAEDNDDDGDGISDDKDDDDDNDGTPDAEDHDGENEDDENQSDTSFISASRSSK